MGFVFEIIARRRALGSGTPVRPSVIPIVAPDRNPTPGSPRFVCSHLWGSFGNNYFFGVTGQWLHFWRRRRTGRRRDGRGWLRWNRRSAAVAHFEEAAVSA